jgi:F420-non-reducing hydrogenase iron-sulfur subunit
MLESLGIDPRRFRLEWVSASEGPKYAEVITDFTRQIKELGPNPLKKGAAK